MAQFWKNSIRKVEARRESVVRFIGEQVGGPAQDVKNALGAILKSHGGVTEAYLARVVFGTDPVFKVTLCMVAQEDPQLLREVEACFHQLFGSDSSMDVLFLTDSQRAELRGVCPPFFVR